MVIKQSLWKDRACSVWLFSPLLLSFLSLKVNGQHPTKLLMVRIESLYCTAALKMGWQEHIDADINVIIFQAHHLLQKKIFLGFWNIACRYNSQQIE